MEEATITNLQDTTMTANEPLIRERFPTVIDTDDLILELGKKEVDRLNKEKLLEGLLKQKKALKETISLVQVELPKLQNEIKALKESNIKYESNNRIIADSLSDIRTKYNKEQEEHTQLKKHSTKLQEDLKSVSSSLSAMQDSYNKVVTEHSKVHGELLKFKEINSTLNIALETSKKDNQILVTEYAQLEEALDNKSKKKIKIKE